MSESQDWSTFQASFDLARPLLVGDIHDFFQNNNVKNEFSQLSPFSVKQKDNKGSITFALYPCNDWQEKLEQLLVQHLNASNVEIEPAATPARFKAQPYPFGTQNNQQTMSMSISFMATSTQFESIQDAINKQTHPKS